MGERRPHVLLLAIVSSVLSIVMTLTTFVGAAGRPGASSTAHSRTIDRRGPHYAIAVKYPELSGKSTADRKINGVLRQDAEAEVAGFLKELKQYESNSEQLPAGAISSLTGTFTRDELPSPLVGYVESFYTMFAEAAHGFDGQISLTFNSTTGEHYGLSDLFRPRSLWLQLLSRESRALLATALGSEAISGDSNSGTTPKEANFADWMLTPFGLELTFGEYQVAAYALGMPSITIPFSALAPVLRHRGPAVFIKKPGAYLILSPATTSPADAECFMTFDYVDLRPLFCNDGRLNVAAWWWFTKEGLRIFGVGRSATGAAVRAMTCRDAGVYGLATAIDAEELASLYYGWDFRSSPVTDLTESCAVVP
jgi:hypothetical protein